MSERKFRLEVSEGELKALIEHNAKNVVFSAEHLTTETSQRIHDLMKRLHRGSEPEISNDPRPNIDETQSSAPSLQDHEQLVENKPDGNW